ncbi:MAG: hypothetical protein NZM37_02965 [Sandaracinaceae bacterium]|nr:hypothetical protein [Sandaracinaceae bacterium]
MRFSIVSISLLLFGCFELTPLGPVPENERSLEACRNGYDDDGDRLVDCRDPDCIRQGLCSRRVPIVPNLELENTPEKCSDFIDNDDDGRFDCGDPNCQSIMELCCSLEFDDEACSNGIDDDGNGFKDCQDSGCSRNPFVTVCRKERICNNRMDDDGDRRIDCEDSDCARAAFCVPGGEEDCDNGIDEDRDGRMDCADRDCYADPICLGPENTLLRCTDGNNNDGNYMNDPMTMRRISLLDCNDPQCQLLQGEERTAFEAYCESIRGPENTIERCMDGVDNDGNGYTDCQDFSCSREDRGASPEAVAYCMSIAENTIEKCSDGVDNDNNGYVDCADFSCSRSSNDVAAFCAARGERSFSRCKDGIDNDQNGYTDCQDFSCREFVEEIIDEMGMPTGYQRSPCRESVGANSDFMRANCADGIDNDQDGFIDCDDWDCNWNPQTRDLCLFPGLNIPRVCG